MTQSQRFFGGTVFAFVGAHAFHWFITPMRHPDAGALRTALVAVQALVGIGGAFWLLRSRRRPESIASAGER